MSASSPAVDGDDRAADRDFLGLEVDDSGCVGSAVVTPALMSPRGSFYGGAGLAIAIAMMEAATDRSAVWTTVQFVASAPEGARLQFHADVRAHGRRTSQVQVTARTGDREVFIALGSTADERVDVSSSLDSMPRVSPPEASPAAQFPFPVDPARTHFGTTDYREPVHLHPADDGAPPRMALWARLTGHVSTTPAMLGYVADIVPASVNRALGRRGGGATSLDNSLRVGPRRDSDWVLLDLRPQAAVNGYGHGSAHLWAQDGTLLGVASQTAVLSKRRTP